MGVDDPHKNAEYLENTLKARLPLVVAGSKSALYVHFFYKNILSAWLVFEPSRTAEKAPKLIVCAVGRR